MRSEEQIQRELEQTKENLERYKSDKQDYNGDDGAERYMFFNNVDAQIGALNKRVANLEEEQKRMSASKLDNK